MEKSVTIRKISTYISLFTVITFLLLPTVAFARTYGAIVAFGDSLSDNGNLQTITGGNAPATWSNGITWVEYLALEFDATLDNNAIGGAMTWGHEKNNDNNNTADTDGGDLDVDGNITNNADIPIPNLGLIGQVNTYIAGEPSFSPSDTLFTIWIGGNDFLELAKGGLKAPDGTPIVEPSVALTNATINIITAVSALYEAGAVNILIMNLPDLGATPAYGLASAEDKANATSLSRGYNSYINLMISNLRGQLPGINITIFDVFTYMNSMIANNTFVNSEGTLMVLDAAGSATADTNGPAADYLFWDTIHPTTKAHEYVGKEVAEVLKDDDDDDDSSCFISSIL